MQPTLRQCDSPYVVTRKMLPNDDICTHFALLLMYLLSQCLCLHGRKFSAMTRMSEFLQLGGFVFCASVSQAGRWGTKLI